MPNLRVVEDGSAVGRRYPLRVLVVDDNKDTALTLATVLKDEGHEVHTLLRGDEALDVCRIFRPDVIITDVNMPGMSGYALAREIHERSGSIRPLLIAMTGVWTGTSDRLLGKAVGFDHYLLKPCDPAEVLRLLEPLRTGQRSAEEGSVGK